MIRRLVFFVLVLTLIFPVAAVFGQADGETLLQRAITVLNAELGTAFARGDVNRWSWEEKFFPDASLDCPQPEMMYAQVTTRGFIVTMEFDGTSYDVRITAESDAAVLCGTTTVEAPPAVAPTTAKDSLCTGKMKRLIVATRRRC